MPASPDSSASFLMAVSLSPELQPEEKRSQQGKPAVQSVGQHLIPVLFMLHPVLSWFCPGSDLPLWIAMCAPFGNKQKELCLLKKF